MRTCSASIRVPRPDRACCISKAGLRRGRRAWPARSPDPSLCPRLQEARAAMPTTRTPRRRAPKPSPPWVDYGSTITKGVTVKPVVAGSTESALTPGATNGSAVQWTGRISLKQAGANKVDLLVTCAKGKGAACGTSKSTSATISNVQRPYAAGTASGPISGAWLSEVGGAQDANSFEVCEPQNTAGCTHNLAVTINVAASLQNSQRFADPTYPIRIGTSQGNVVGCGANPSPSASQYRQTWLRDALGRLPSILRIQRARPRGQARMTV